MVMVKGKAGFKDAEDDGDDSESTTPVGRRPQRLQPRSRKVEPDKGGERLASGQAAGKKATKRKPSQVRQPGSQPATTKQSKSATILSPNGGRSLILPDTRKLTKKAADSLRVQWSEANRAKTRDRLMQGMIASAKAKFGVSKVFGSREEIEQLSIGIPVPSLAFEYLIGNDIFPFCLVMIAGQWGTCKSAMLYEIFRWFYEQNGWPFHVDTEFKFDADFACSIMRVSEATLPITSARAASLEEMQKLLTHFSSNCRKICEGTKEEPGPGKTVPVCFGLDSLVGAASEEIIDKIGKEGAAGRAFPIGALKNSGYLTAIKSMMDGWPFSLVIVNHLKQQTTDSGDKQDYTPGGQAFNFHESFEIHTSKWRSNISNMAFEGVGIRLKCAKNSFGPTGRKVKTRFIWWVEDDEDGRPHDVHVWDWNWSLCTLLNETTGKERERLRNRGLLINVKSPAADVECLANFPAIGMGKKEYLPFQEVGQLIQNDTKVCGLIRDALNIKRRHSLGSQSYEEVESQHRKKLK